MRKYPSPAILLLLCFFAQAMIHARTAALTFDEGPHLAVGYATLRTGDLRLQPVHIHPPLANVLAAAPLLLQHDLPDPRTVGGWEIASLSAVTDEVVWRYPHPERIALAGRFPIVLMTLLLGAIVFRWACDLFGPRAGLLALALCAFDPNIIAHGSLVTTDMAVVLWGTLALFLTWRYLRGNRVGAGLAPAQGAGLAPAQRTGLAPAQYVI
ncbi:MAG: glycosyltransferase family 39 protein, partial [Anaerolineae bacterium]|nr:glycosyltransferase family 39 protein [Anaerolineae bacterium]